MKNIVLCLILSCIVLNINAQQFSAKVIDENNNPIPYATIQTGENTGVITNEEGFFTINVEGDSINSIKISSLGFTSITLNLNEIIKQNYIITLSEHVEELDQVYLSNVKLNADSIIKKVVQNLSKNYNHNNKSFKLFYRKSTFIDFEKLDFEIDKVSGLKQKKLDKANTELRDLTQSIKTSEAVFYKDYLANLYFKNSSNKKIDVIKATTLLDKNRSFSIDKVQKKAQNIILKYLDTTFTYKLKSGLFKIEDSLSLKSEKLRENDSINTFDSKNLTSETNGIINLSNTHNSPILQSILDTDQYDYTFKEVTVFDGNLVYVISYYPSRSKAKFSGKIYITDEDFAVLKLDYGYAEGKRGQKLNLKLLLGVKYAENIKNGIILYKKNRDNIYQPHYISQKTGSFFYVGRPLKFIENSDDRTKIKISFKIEGINTQKEEVYIINNTKINDVDFDKLTFREKVPYQELKAYDPSIWKKYNALEPLNKMKNFKSLEN